MKSLKEQFISEVVREVVERVGPGRAARIMDLGCGTAVYVPALMKEFPGIQYVGVEPIASSFKKAEENLKGIENTKLHFKLGYDSIPDETDESFDLVFSLSALEHIRQLDRFIALSSKYVRKGGLLMHRYDLGHALHPHSLKEKLHVFLGNTVPKLLPERKFVRYVPEKEVRALYETNGVTPLKTTYHQMQDLKALEKELKGKDTTAIDEAFAWEMKHQKCFLQIPFETREKLFPAVAVWGEKK